MDRQEAEKVLYNAMCIGEHLLRSGAEVSRVEDTIERICRAYGAIRVDVFSITSSIVTTMYMDDFETVTQSRRVRGMKNDMTKLEALNNLSRRICKEKMSPEEVRCEIEKIKEASWRPLWMCILAYAVISGVFTVTFGGDYMDMLAAAIIGAVLKMIETSVSTINSNSFLVTLLCGVSGGFMANLLVKAGIGNHVDMISIGNIMLFIPGMMFVNSIRDLFSGDTLTGVVKCMESLLLAMVLAVGFTFANFFF